MIICKTKNIFNKKTNKKVCQKLYQSQNLLNLKVNFKFQMYNLYLIINYIVLEHKIVKLANEKDLVLMRIISLQNTSREISLYKKEYLMIKISVKK